MKDFKKQVIKLFGEQFKIGDKFKAITNQMDDFLYGDENEDYIGDNIYKLMIIDYVNIELPINFICVTTGKCFWITFNEIFNFEKIGE